MITVRGVEIAITPLTAFEHTKVSDAVACLGTCSPTIKVLLPENFPSLVIVVTAVVRRSIPDISFAEVSAALNWNNITAVLNGLTSTKRNGYIHPEISREQ